MNLIILGPQGSGKGTQASVISDKLGLIRVETGEILRRLAKKDKKLEKLLTSGKLLADSDTVKLMENYLTESGWGYDNIIFDGFPRRISQYKYLINWLKGKGSGIDWIIYLKLSALESVKRLSGRRICKVCGRVYNILTSPKPIRGKCRCGGELYQRNDDTPEAIRKRLQLFNLKTIPILDLTEARKKVIEIDGNQSIDKVSQDIFTQLEKRK